MAAFRRRAARLFAAGTLVMIPSFSQRPPTFPGFHGEILTGEVSPDQVRIENPAPAGAPTISARELRRPPSKAASRAFAQALRDSAAGEHVKAIGELRKVVAEAPEYAQAWSNLGVQYLLLTQAGDGIDALEQAARLMPEAAIIHTNLSYAYHLASRWDRAEAEARKAVQLDKNYAKAHYVLGIVLLARRVNLEEAVENLKLASAEIPRARLILAALPPRP